MSSASIVDWGIRSHVGVGILRFGQPRTDARSLLGQPSRVFKTVPFADTLTDCYEHLGLHLLYDPQDCLESVDAVSPSRIRFRGIVLLDEPAEKVAEAIAKLGCQHEGYVFEEASFSLYVVEGIVKSVTVFADGCHDTTNPNSQRSRAFRAAEEWRRSRMQK